MTVLESRNLSAGYGSTEVVRNASFRLHAGEIVALLGPNGIGKTTLIRALTRALKPMGGTVELFGRDVARLSSSQIARTVARVVQSPQLAWAFTVRHVVSLGRWAHHGWFGQRSRNDEAVVERAMRDMAIDHLAERDFSTLSGGEAQRTLVAQALAQEPSLLVMDEPVAHLDLHHQIATLDLVRGLADRGMSVLASLHDINLAAMYADRIALIDRRGHVSIGPPAELLTTDCLESLFGVRLSRVYSPAHEAEYVLPIPGAGRQETP